VSKVAAKFAELKNKRKGRKWEYATITLKSPRDWRAYEEYGVGPSMARYGNLIVITVRREKKS
jgi:hypothetical protein